MLGGVALGELKGDVFTLTRVSPGWILNSKGNMRCEGDNGTSLSREIGTVVVVVVVAGVIGEGFLPATTLLLAGEEEGSGCTCPRLLTRRRLGGKREEALVVAMFAFAFEVAFTDDIGVPVRDSDGGGLTFTGPCGTDAATPNPFVRGGRLLLLPAVVVVVVVVVVAAVMVGIGTILRALIRPE
jgi:hypothetical protein